MKKITLLSTLVLILAGSCKKYPDGPAISLRSKKERLANSWVISKAIEDGTDKTGDYQAALKDYNIIIDKGGTYSLSYIGLGLFTITENGNWSFSSDKTRVTFDPTSNNNDNNEWKILKLKEEELWVLDEDYNDKKLEIHFTPK